MSRIHSLRAAMVVAIAFAATAAVAQDRLDAHSASCARIKSAVQSEGAIVINTSRTAYNRYVSNGSFCFYNQITKAEWVDAADQDDCFVGYSCQERDGTRLK